MGSGLNGLNPSTREFAGQAAADGLDLREFRHVGRAFFESDAPDEAAAGLKCVPEIGADMDFMPMADPWTEWAGDMAKWGMIVGLLFFIIMVGGIVLIVRAIARRRQETSRGCSNCGKSVRAGNTNCPACGSKVNWA